MAERLAFGDLIRKGLMAISIPFDPGQESLHIRMNSYEGVCIHKI